MHSGSSYLQKVKSPPKAGGSAVRLMSSVKFWLEQVGDGGMGKAAKRSISAQRRQPKTLWLTSLSAMVSKER